MQKVGAMASFWVCFAKKTSERQPKPFNQSPSGGLSGAGGEKNVQGWRKWSTGLNGLCSPGGRQECLPYLNACRYLCDFRRNAPEGRRAR